VRLVQEARKASGLSITDRIALWWTAADGELAEALREHASTVAGEVLATSYQEGLPDGDAEGADLHRHGDPDLGLSFVLRRT
jgi:isoleucyl-tRNA synthetase